MLLTVKELISLLREAVNISNEESQLEDSGFLNMTDDDLAMFLKLGTSKVFPNVEDLNDLPQGSSYPVILSAKKELYLKLAVTKANLIDLTADNNNQLKQSQRFSHYMKLAENAETEFQNWIANGGSIADSETGVQGINTYTVLLSKNHYSRLNYEKGRTPSVKIKVHDILIDSVLFSWTSTNHDHFGRYVVYISEFPIVDMFRDGSKFTNKVDERAIKILSTRDFKNNKKRVEGLKPDTDYYIAVFSLERNQLFGFKETLIHTLNPSDDEDFSVDSIGG